MNEIQRRKVFQKVKSLTNDQFWDWMNGIHTQAYFRGQENIIEAMSCHPRISKPMIEQVKEKAVEVRENWDGMKTVDVEGGIMNYIHESVRS